MSLRVFVSMQRHLLALSLLFIRANEQVSESFFHRQFKKCEIRPILSFLSNIVSYYLLTMTTHRYHRPGCFLLLELYPSPQSCASNSSYINIIGRNSCGIQPDIVSLNCSLRYQGNIQPFLKWTTGIGNPVFSTQRTIDNRTTVSTVTLKAAEKTSAKYTCLVQYMNASLVSKFSCTLDVNITSK